MHMEDLDSVISSKVLVGVAEDVEERVYKSTELKGVVRNEAAHRRMATAHTRMLA